MYHCWESGQKLLVPGPAQTPLASKHARAWPVATAGGSACWPAVWATPPEMWVPGAIMSGFLRPSEQGPRLENEMTSIALSAPESAIPHWSAAPKAWTPSEAPDVKTFFAVPGEPTVPAPEPLLPAAKRMTISWFPEFGTAEPVGWASRTRAS